MTRPAPIGLALLVALSAYCHSGCGSTPAYTDPEPVRPIMFAITEESACYGATSYAGATRTDLGWVDRYHRDEWGRTVLTYRGEIVWTCPYPRRHRSVR